MYTSLEGVENDAFNRGGGGGGDVRYPQTRAIYILAQGCWQKPLPQGYKSMHDQVTGMHCHRELHSGVGHTLLSDVLEFSATYKRPVGASSANSSRQIRRRKHGASHWTQVKSYLLCTCVFLVPAKGLHTATHSLPPPPPTPFR